MFGESYLTVWKRQTFHRMLAYFLSTIFNLYKIYLKLFYLEAFSHFSLALFLGFSITIFPGITINRPSIK